MDLSNPTRNPKPLLVFGMFVECYYDLSYYYAFPCLLRTINPLLRLYIDLSHLPKYSSGIKYFFNTNYVPSTSGFLNEIGLHNDNGNDLFVE